MSERVNIAYAQPGDVVHFRCEHCAELYRLTVQPRRDVERAIRRLKEQDDVPYAMKLLDEAYADLCGIAEYLTEIESPQSTTTTTPGAVPSEGRGQ